MKKLFLFLLILPLAFVACSDDDETIEPKTDIVGTWIFTKTTAKATTKNDTDNKLAKAIEEFYTAEDGSSFTFKADGSFVDAFDSGITGKYTLSEEVITLKYDKSNSEDDIYNITFENKNTLLFSHDDTEDAKMDFSADKDKIEKVILFQHLKRQESIISEDLIGSWILKERVVAEIEVKDDKDGKIAQAIKNDHLLPEGEVALFNFNNNNSYSTSSDGEIDDEGTYFVQGIAITIQSKENDANKKYTGIFNIIGNTLTLALDVTESVKIDYPQATKVIVTYTFEAKK